MDQEDAEIDRQMGASTEAPTLRTPTARTSPSEPLAVPRDTPPVVFRLAPQPPSQVPPSSDSHASKGKGKSSCDADEEAYNRRVLMNMQNTQSTPYTVSEQPGLFLSAYADSASEPAHAAMSRIP